MSGTKQWPSHLDQHPSKPLTSPSDRPRNADEAKRPIQTSKPR